jgi:endoglucanase
MLRVKVAGLILLIPLLTFAADKQLTINDLEYFDMPGLNVMVFHDYYPEGHQSGITIIQNGERVAANGDIRLNPAPGQWQPVPKAGKKTVYREKNEIRITLTYPDSSRNKKGFNPIDYPGLHFSYTIRVIGERKSIRIVVDLDHPIPDAFADQVGFNLELFPGLLFGKTYYMDKHSGIFPHQANGPMFMDQQDEVQILPMAEGKKLVVAPESDASRLVIRSLSNPIQLIDGRGKHNNGWFIVRSLIKEGATRKAVEWIVTPSVIPNWKYKPVIHISQVGYHPKQQKIAVIELDQNDKKIRKAVLKHVGLNGQQTEILSVKPLKWGKFLRYNYLQFNFTRIQKSGIFIISYGTSQTEPFQIKTDVFNRHVWQPTLEYFLPVQMCHMKVMDRYRVWHGLCHMDDALMAPVNHNHFDGYQQGPSTLTRFNPYDPVPGLNVGGWHDAGDYDLRIESQANTVYILSLAHETFHIDYDATTIDQEDRLVEMHLPDSVPDILQQIEHGVLSIIGGYNALGRLYRGIICPTIRQYVFLGDGSTMTDNYPSGRDDRWVFTEENQDRELGVAASLASASRVLKGYNDSLSAECQDIAVRLWQANEEKESRFKVNAAVELLITTGNPIYRDFILSEKEDIIENSPWSGWILGRVLRELNDPEFSRAVYQALANYKIGLDEQMKGNPFRVPYHPHVWGAGWMIQYFGVSQYFLHIGFPELFPKENMLNALNFVLGCHPGPNTASFASGVGSRSTTVAYGVNRADWSYIPGGVCSGTALIRPDFPELKEWPFLWQQTEYVMGGGASNFMFLILAADQLLNQ